MNRDANDAEDPPFIYTTASPISPQEKAEPGDVHYEYACLREYLVQSKIAPSGVQVGLVHYLRNFIKTHLRKE